MTNFILIFFKITLQFPKILEEVKIFSEMLSKIWQKIL